MPAEYATAVDGDHVVDGLIFGMVWLGFCTQHALSTPVVFPLIPHHLGFFHSSVYAIGHISMEDYSHLPWP